MNEELTKLIYENEKLIYSFMKDYSNYIDKEDLYQVGCIGLINAYNNFKKEKGVKFSTYAYMYIQGEIKKFIRENRTFKINKDVNKLCNSVKKAKGILEQRLMKEPSIKDLADFLELTEKEIEFALGINAPVQSADKPIMNDGKEVVLYDIIGSNNTTNNLDIISLKEELSKLSYQDKRILQERYFNDKTQSEVAHILGMSQVKVSREEKKVLQKLRNNMVA